MHPIKYVFEYNNIPGICPGFLGQSKSSPTLNTSHDVGSSKHLPGYSIIKMSSRCSVVALNVVCKILYLSVASSVGPNNMISCSGDGSSDNSKKESEKMIFDVHHTSLTTRIVNRPTTADGLVWIGMYTYPLPEDRLPGNVVQ